MFDSVPDSDWQADGPPVRLGGWFLTQSWLTCSFHSVSALLITLQLNQEHASWVFVCHLLNKSISKRQGQTSSVYPRVFTSLGAWSIFQFLSLSRVVGSPARDDNYCHVPSCYWNLSHTHTLCWHHHRWRLCPQPVSWSQPVTHMFVCLRRICQVSHANRFFRVRQILCRFSVTQVCFMRRSLLGKHTHPIFKKIFIFTQTSSRQRNPEIAPQLISRQLQSSQKFRICK